jgi:hypothetical protein
MSARRGLMTAHGRYLPLFGSIICPCLAYASGVLSAAALSAYSLLRLASCKPLRL